MNKRNIIALAVAAAAAAGAAAWALRPAPVASETAIVASGPFEQTISDDGKTRVRDRYVVSTPLAGRLDRIRLRAGDTVEAGQVVALLAPSAPAFLDARTERELTERIGAAEAQQLRARAEVQRADAQLGQARADRNRSARLATGGFLSPAAREQAELALRSAEKSLEAARFVEHAAGHDVEQARASLVRYRAESAVGAAGASTGGSARPRWEVKSPVRGAVLRVLQESEGVVAAGTPLVEIADSRSLEAVVDVLSQEAVNLRPGMAARIRLGIGSPPLPATVRHVEPAAFTKVSALGVEEQRVNVVLDFAAPINAAQTVGDAYRIEVDIVAFRTAQAVIVPLGALFRAGPDWSAWVVEDGRARLRTVKTSRRNGSVAMVDEGLKAGDTVLLYPADAVKDGARISIKAAQAPAPAAAKAGAK